MKLLKIIITSFTLFLLLNNCGYTPIYSSKDNNFNVNISQTDRSKLNSKIENHIKNFINKNSENTIELKINTNKIIKIISKDNKGDPSRFSMVITLNVNFLGKNNYEINKTESFTENFDYENNSNKFSLKQYEKDIEDNLVSKIVERLIIYLVEL